MKEQRKNVEKRFSWLSRVTGSCRRGRAYLAAATNSFSTTTGPETPQDVHMSDDSDHCTGGKVTKQYVCFYSASSFPFVRM